MGLQIKMVGNGYTRLDTSILDRIQAAIKKQYFVRVGVLGAKTHTGEKPRLTTVDKKGGGHKKGKSQSSLSNADIGFIHEFGSDSQNIPARSWLRMPLGFKLPGVFQQVGQKLINQMHTGNIVESFKTLGARAEAIIQQAFASRGFGNWAKNKDATIARKGSDAPLIDTAQFRKSITSEVASR